MSLKYLSMPFLPAVLIGCDSSNNKPIQIGVLHSLTGTMTFSERDLVDTVSLLIEPIKASVAVLGRALQALVVDDESNLNRIVLEAERLEVPVIFGCWTSACRKTLKTIRPFTFPSYHTDDEWLHHSQILQQGI